MTTLAQTNYAGLLEDVRRVLVRGRTEAREAVEQVKVQTYWEVGRLVNEHLRVHDGRAGYGERVVNRLSEDLEMGKSLVYEILQFHRTFPIFHTYGKLEWSHYRILSRIEDSKERDILLRRTVRQHLSARDLLQRVGRKQLTVGVSRQLTPENQSAVVRSLKPRRGNFYTYQIVQSNDLHEGPEDFSADLGFAARIRLSLAGIKNPKEGQIVEAVRTRENSSGDRYRFKRSRSGKEVLYTYKATVEKVIDDDTLWAQVDLGFRVWTRQKLRLRGVNAAEVGKGREASDFVQKTLARVSFVVVKLSGRDKFDRYLTDLFFLEGAEEREKVLREGVFLNQLLLDRGLAKRV